MPAIIQIIEGFSLLVAGALVLVTLKRKGQNRMFAMLAWFFVAGGVFRLSMFVPGVLPWFAASAAFPAISLAIGNSCLYFGLVGYGSAQLRLLQGARAGQLMLALGGAVAALLTIFHLLPAVLPSIAPGLASVVAQRQLPVMLTVMVVALLAIVGILLATILHLRRLNIPITGSAVMHLGLGFMLLSWVLQKLVQTDVPILQNLLSAGPFVAIIIAIAAVYLQSSASMAPGVVYDAMSHRPIALAIVRLFRQSDRKLLETRVTGADGRFGLLVEPGDYLLDVQKEGYAFPAASGEGYRGDVLAMKKPALIGRDVFLDPVERSAS